MTEDAFWQLSPIQFTVLCRRLKLAEQRHDYRFGTLTALTYNLNVSKGGKSASDFYPSLALPKPKAPKEMSKEERQAAAKAFFAGMMGGG